METTKTQQAQDEQAFLALIKTMKADRDCDEDKAGFVKALNDMLIVFGNGRYDYLAETPLVYVPTYRNGHLIAENVTCGPHVANVYGDSLIGIIGDIHNQIF